MKKMNIPLMGALLVLSVIVCPILYFTVGPTLDGVQLDTLKILGFIAAGSAAFCFIVGEATGNNSQMDKLWSLLPIAYTWVISAKGGMQPRLVVMAVLAKNLVRSAIGREWMAIRDMDVAASVIGIRPMYAKLSAFAVSSFIVGVAGALWAFVHLGAWEPAAFSVDISFKLLFMVIIGGLGSIMGSFFGAAFIIVLPIVLNLVLPALASLVGMQISTAGISHAEFIIFGALIVWFLIVEPHGIAKLWSTGKQKMRVWPFPH